MELFQVKKKAPQMTYFFFFWISNGYGNLNINQHYLANFKCIHFKPDLPLCEREMAIWSIYLFISNSISTVNVSCQSCGRTSGPSTRKYTPNCQVK